MFVFKRFTGTWYIETLVILFFLEIKNLKIFVKKLILILILKYLKSESFLDDSLCHTTYSSGGRAS